MRLEIFPYRFRGKANAAILHHHPSTISELKGAKALYDLYMSGASFRLMPNSPIDAVVFDLDALSVADAVKLDRYGANNVFVAKSPSAVLSVPGKENRRKVFYGLSEEYSYAEYAQAYGNAFMQFATDAGLGSIAYDHCMDSPRQMTFGRPYPDMGESAQEVDIAEVGEMRVPMPLSRDDAKELFGIDKKVMLPSWEYFCKSKPNKGERSAFIWRRIIPAAFAWFNFFETTAETRWGLNVAGFEFKDCVRAIERELEKIGVPVMEAAEVIQGDLYGAYYHFTVPPLTAYSPRTEKTGHSYWSKITDMRKQEIYARHHRQARARRRLRRMINGPKPRRKPERKRKPGLKPIWKRKPGRKPTLIIGSLADLENLWQAGRISKPYYYRKRKELSKGESPEA